MTTFTAVVPRDAVRDKWGTVITVQMGDTTRSGRLIAMEQTDQPDRVTITLDDETSRPAPTASGRRVDCPLTVPAVLTVLTGRRLCPLPEVAAVLTAVTGAPATSPGPDWWGSDVADLLRGVLRAQFPDLARIADTFPDYVSPGRTPATIRRMNGAWIDGVVACVGPVRRLLLDL